jgi:hypothetical protein
MPLTRWDPFRELDGLLSMRGEGKRESLTLPGDVDTQKIGAGFAEGVRKAHVPKSPQAKPHTIRVTVA